MYLQHTKNLKEKEKEKKKAKKKDLFPRTRSLKVGYPDARVLDAKRFHSSEVQGRSWRKKSPPKGVMHSNIAPSTGNPSVLVLHLVLEIPLY